ncbi:MAG: DeoR/GlpR transcriptional regulator [Clostridia bacterium]|nr:DeoR/GlpR transcriptional regulator [Clostridia bacterium]
MELNSRQKKILEKINNTGSVRVAELSETLYFSEMTIRRDLQMMEKEGLLKRVHGGAVMNESEFKYPMWYRMEINKEQKKELARRAKKHLRDGQVIFFNSSSTLSYLLPYLRQYKNLTVITNSVHILFQTSKMHIPCFLTGGRYNEIEGSLSGRQAETFLKTINPDIAFLSCEALSEDGQVTDGDADIAEIDKIAVERAKTSVLLMDRSKIGALLTYTVCRTDDLTEVILF